MLNFRSIIQSLVFLSLLITLTGCPDSSSMSASKSNGSSDSNSHGNDNGGGSPGNTNGDEPAVSLVSIKSVSISNNAFIISGSNLNSITGLKIQGSPDVKLVISQKSSSQITAKSSSALSLFLGAAYSMIVSSANAADAVVPITIQIADNSLSPTTLTGSGASVGQVLQWNGTSWLPASLPTNSSSSGDSSSSAVGPWLYINGVKVARVLGAGISTQTIQVWDSVDNVIVTYFPSNSQSSPVWTAAAPGGLYFVYTTSNCSDTPHAFGQGGAFQIPQMGFSMGGSFYKTGSQADLITPIAIRDNGGSGALGTCSSFSSYTQSLYPVTVIASPGVPVSFSQRSFQILGQ